MSSKLVGLMKVRNEQWVLGLSLPAALRCLDEVVIVDHCSTDRTPEIIDRVASQHPDRVHALRWSDPAWAEAAIMQALLERGREIGGTHFVILDADEVISGNVAKQLEELVAPLKPAEGLALPWLAMWNAIDRYRDDDSEWTDNLMLFAFADDERLSFQPAGDGYDIHQRNPARLRGMRKPIRRGSDGG
ncbi:MAG: glycosyltransferase, partial [Planctomycetota bacterium]